MTAPSSHWYKRVQVAQRIGTEASIAVVSAGLLSLDSSACLDESFGCSLVGLHFVSGLDERVHDWLLAKNRSSCRGKDVSDHGYGCKMRLQVEI